MIILETDRILLRHLLKQDLADLYRIYCNPEVIRFIPDAPKNYAETVEELEWHQQGDRRNPKLGLWAAIYKPSGQFIGRCGLLPWELEGRQEVEVAYLLDQPFWGQGLATEAAGAIARYGYEYLGFSRLVSLIDPLNLASQRVAEKIGMHFEKAMQDELGPFWLYSTESRFS